MMADIDAMLRELEGPKPTFGAASQDERARRVLESLEQLGELRPAEAAELARLREAQGANRTVMEETEAAYRGALQGATFNFADEVYGLFGGDKEAARARNAYAGEAYPEKYARGKLGGAVTSGLATAAAAAPYLAGKTLLGTMGRGAVFGGAEGALAGAGGGEGWADKARQAGTQGAIGAVVGAAAPALAYGGAKVVGGVADMIGGAMNRGNSGRASRAILDTIRKAGKTVPEVTDDIARAAQGGQPQYRLMDAMGLAGQRQASGVVRAGGDGAEEIAKFLRQRQIDQPDRLGGFIDDAFETGGTTAEATRQALRANRKAVADPMYDAARASAGPVDVRGAVQVIDDRIGGMAGSNIAGDSIDGRLATFRRRLVANPAPDGEISRELSDFSRVLGVKQDVGDAVEAAFRAGRNNEARELAKLRDALDSALEDASDAYRFANDNFREASRVIDSVDTGATMATRGRAADNVGEIQRMTDDQRRAARIGYGDRVLQSIEGNRAAAPNAAREFNSTKRMTEAQALAVNPDQFLERIGRENTMSETFQRALGGSRTADNLEDVANVGALADAARAASATASGNIGTALATVGNSVAHRLTGKNDATRKIIADMLMGTEPAKALAGAVKSAKRSEIAKRFAEAIMRAMAREPDAVSGEIRGYR